jgi:3-hydroxybutyryl-CoA dehydrogenase
MPDETIGVVGAGTMGAGIAQLALEAGHEVVLHDVDEAAIERGRAKIRDGLERRAARLDLDADTIDQWVEGRYDRLRDGHSLDAVAAEADVVIEAALEDLELKRTLFRTLDAASSADTILATNTSALSIAAIAEAASQPARVVGLHFFNPAPVMRLVEVVSGPATSPAVAARASVLVASWGREPVAVVDSPGFIVNRVNRPFTLEALAALEQGQAGVEGIDEAVRAAGYPMGPFELMDLVGIDVNLAAARGVWEGFDRADRFAPSPIQERLVDEERLGRKSGRGFYRYQDGVRGEVAFESASAGREGPADEVARRIEVAILAEAWRALGDGIATEHDIDQAMRLGAGHRVGPFERTEELGGPAALVATLDAIPLPAPRFDMPPRLLETASSARPTAG